MKVLEVIKNKSHFIITIDGNILAINNGNNEFYGKKSELSKEDILNMEVLKVDNINGHTNYLGIRI